MKTTDHVNPSSIFLTSLFIFFPIQLSRESEEEKKKICSPLSAHVGQGRTTHESSRHAATRRRGGRPDRARGGRCGGRWPARARRACSEPRRAASARRSAAVLACSKGGGGRPRRCGAEGLLEPRRETGGRRGGGLAAGRQDGVRCKERDRPERGEQRPI